MQDKLDIIVDKVCENVEGIEVKVCESLPLNATFFEKDGNCSKPSDKCKYCKPLDKTNYSCYKKTYTRTPGMALRFV